jgi:hypothetical protein
MRLAKDLQCFKVESYGFATKAIDEIGKQVCGWLKSRSGTWTLKRTGDSVPVLTPMADAG